jgi:hypothetical protein
MSDTMIFAAGAIVSVIVITASLLSGYAWFEHKEVESERH